MSDFRVHQVRFFHYVPKGITNLSYSETNQKLALSRMDGSIEILGNWYKEKVIPADKDRSVEALAWVGNRLFSAGFSGEVIEYDLLRLAPKAKAHCNAGSIWCMVKNSSNTRLAVGTDGGAVVLFNIENNDLEYLKAFSKQEGRILCLDWHVSEDVIVTGGVNNIRVWSVNSGIAIERFTLKRNKIRDVYVWCIKILMDMTVVSGDSHGRITFWDSKFGTELQCIWTHKADVLCLAVNRDENLVVGSGVDASIVHITNMNSDSAPHHKRAKGKHGGIVSGKSHDMWTRSSVLHFHFHDIRDALFVGNQLVLGSMDTNLTVVTSPTRFMKISGLPHKQLVHTAKDANVLLLQYPTYLEVWKLGHSSVERVGTEKEILPLDSHPVKQIQIASKNNKAIVCSTISNNAKLLAYSTVDQSRIYCIKLPADQSKSEKPSVERLADFSNELPPAHQMIFTPDGTKFILATDVGTLQIHNFKQNEVTCINPAKGITDSIHLLEVSSDGQYVATGNGSGEVHVFATMSGEHVTTVPVRKYLPTAISFHPNKPVLFLAYSDLEIHEYCYTKNDYTMWSKQGRRNFHPQWLQRNSKITDLMYNPNNENQLIIYDEKMICVLDKTHPFPDRSIKYKRFGAQGPQSELHAFHITGKFKFILGLKALSDGQLVLVERTPKAIKDDLPPVLKMKKFGSS